MPCRVRPYAPADRAAVRRICADTGFMGNPIDPVFVDREVFADFFTRYYTDWEPESARVAEDEATGEVVGYLLGCRRWRRQAWVSAWLLVAVIVPKVLWRILTLRYNRQSVRFLAWTVFRGPRQTPAAPDGPYAHFHINLLPAWRDGGAARRLIFPYIENLAATGSVRGVYGQMQTRDDRRTPRLFERYGFRVLERRRITKFARFDPTPVYVATIAKDF